MADPHWTSYVGMASGLAGAIMGNHVEVQVLFSAPFKKPPETLRDTL